MAAIVPYAAQAAFAAERFGEAETMAKAARTIYRFVRKHTTKGQQKRAAQTAFRAARRSFKKPKREMPAERVGHSPNDSTGKVTEAVDTVVNAGSTRTLTTHRLDYIPHSTTTNIWAYRQRHQIYVSGFKICMEMTNLQPTRLYFNFAVVSPKHATTVSTTDFFREPGGSDSKGRNFDNTLSALEFHCNAINPDEYTILKHERMLVAGDVPATRGSGTDNWVGHANNQVRTYWIPLKRQIRFDSPSDNHSQTPMYAVWWCDVFGTATAVTPVASSYYLRLKTFMYWRDAPKCC